MNDITFLYPPSTSFSHLNADPHFDYCLGSAYCISYLVQQGFNAESLLTKETIDLNEGVKLILEKKPKIVGFTVYDTNYCACQLIARLLKKINANIIIIFGGPTPSVQAKTILKSNPFVDICVRHEGEETCLELLQVLETFNFNWKKVLESSSLEEIRGISFRIGDQIIENSDRNILQTHAHEFNFLDKYPSPYLNGLLKSPSHGIITARGCNQHCTYCNCAIISKRIIATHSIDRVIQELDYISRLPNRNPENVVDIFDDAFTLLPRRALKICNQLIENKIQLPLSCTTRCDRVDEELLEKMKEAGFKSIAFALESAVPRILRIIGKVHPPHTKNDPNFIKENDFINKFIKYTTLAKKIGIDIVSASIMIGLPSETEAEGQRTIDMIKSLGDILDSYAHNIFQILPGTPIFYNYKSLGLDLKKLDNQIHYKTLHSYDTSKIKPAPKAHLNDDIFKQNRLIKKILSLSTTNKKPMGCFKQITLWADIITEDFIVWMQDNLVIDGIFIQIYSNYENTLKFQEDNQHKLYRYITPTSFNYTFYCVNSNNGHAALMPYKKYIYPSKRGALQLINTKYGLLNLDSQKDTLNTLCIEKSKEDAFQFYQFLCGLIQQKNSVHNLFNSSPLPYFCSLCRWENKIPNCQLLESVMVDSNHQIKTCWNGNAIGEIGISFNDLSAKLKKIKNNILKQRECFQCKQQEQCTQCLFPSPMSSEEYCAFRKKEETGAVAQLIRTFDAFKEI